MKKILILANNDVGLYKFRKEVIQELIEEYKVYISLPYGDYIPKLQDLGCEYIETSISRRGTNPVTDIKLFKKYIDLIKKIKPELVLSYTIKPNVYGGLACRMSNVPYIVNVTGLGSAVENGGFMQKISLFLYRSSLKKATCVFFQNKGNYEYFQEKKVFSKKNRLIPGSGVNLKDYKLLDYPLTENIHFLFIARVMKEKGIDQYLEAAEYIKNKYKNTVFHILGSCEEDYENKLNEMQDRGIVQYHGMQSDVREFQKISHCTIHPTYYPEGMSNVLLESAACGRPIITTNRSGCREIVDNGVNGYIVEQKSSHDLIEKIEQFLMLTYEEKKAMGLAGRVKVECEFDRGIVINSYLKEIQNI
ncbi:glycosyltransferase family 4 protein [Paenibacillus sp. FSL R10-2734]|uniref:glycosyltransferase family 4 protein n=1 Tax=Paenibacillus sp. FSL R10-2734 TaxID=2954691 RepID=UPI0030D9AF94